MTRVIYTPDIFLQRVGGISRYYCELIRRLPVDTFRARVAAGLHRNSYLRRLGGIAGLYIPRLGPFGRFREPFNRAFFRYLAAKDPSAIVHQTYYSECEYPASHPLVLTVVDMIDQHFPDMPTSVPYDVKLRNCTRANHIIAISNTTKDDIVKGFGILPEKIAVIHLADSLPQSVRRANRMEGAPYLLYVGLRAYYKNFARFAEAFAKSKFLRSNFSLVAFGGGNFSKMEEAFLSDLGIARQVRHVSGGDQKLVKYYRNATALVYPSLYEGFGLPVLEAMGQNCPVICSKYGSLPEVAGDAAAYFDAANVDDMQSVMEKTLGNPGQLEELRHLGKARHALFIWEKCAQETMEVYRRLVR